MHNREEGLVGENGEAVIQLINSSHQSSGLEVVQKSEEKWKS